MYWPWIARLVARCVRAASPVFLMLLTTAPFITPVVAADPPTRAMWVSAQALESSEGIRRALAATVAAGVPVVVASAPLYPEPGPDRFLELVQQAHEHQLLVFASIDIDRATPAGEVPASRQHVVYQHPEWLMVPRALAAELLPLDTRSPEYVGRLARWSRGHGIDGVYLSPVPNDAPAYVAALVSSALKRYPVDGIQLEAARYPADDFDYGRQSIDAFRQTTRPSLSSAERARVDSDELLDPFAYPNAFPDAWRRFRQTQLTRLVQAVRDATTSATPGIPVVAGVSGSIETDLQNHFQDWRAWIEEHLIDGVSIRAGSTATIVADPADMSRAEADPISSAR